MKRPQFLRALRVRACTFAVAGFFSLPAQACCTDFWSCAAAVASAGLTCAEEAALKAAHELTELVLRQRDQAVRAVEEAANNDARAAQGVVDQWQRRAEAAAAETTRAVARAAQLMGDDGTRRAAPLDAMTQTQPMRPGQSNPNSARLARLERSVERTANLGAPPDHSMADVQKQVAAADRQVQDLQRSNAQLSAQSRATIDHAKAEFIAKQVAIVTSGFAALSARFAIGNSNDDKAKLLALAGNVLLVTQFIDQLVLQLDRDLTRDGGAFHQRLMISADDPRDSALSAESQVLRVREWMAAMERMARLQSLQEREQIARPLLAATPPGGVPPRNVDRISMTLSAPSAINASMRASLARVRDAVQRLPATARRPDVTPMRKQAEDDLQARFRGKSPAEAARLRDEMLAEARRRFGGQPQWLPDVEALIQQAMANRPR